MEDYSKKDNFLYYKLKIVHYLKNSSIPGFKKIGRFVEPFLLKYKGSWLISPTIYGFDLKVNIADEKNGLEYEVFRSGTYEKGTLHFMRNTLKEGDIFIDAGSNIGLMSLYASKFVGKSGSVYSFEPMPSTFEILKNNITLNGIENIHPFCLALGSGKSKANIYHHNENRGSASLIMPSESADGFITEVVSLEVFLEEKNINKIDMLKIDVEGWELEVLKGATGILESKDPPIVCVEYSNLHPVESGKLLDIYLYLKKLDYKIFKLKKGKGAISELLEIKGALELPKHDNLFCLPTNKNISLLK